jgi:hypothetical protein
MRTVVRLAFLVIVVLVEDGLTLLAMTGNLGQALPPTALLTPAATTLSGPVATRFSPAQDPSIAPSLTAFGMPAGDGPQARAGNPLIAPPASCRAADLFVGQGQTPTETNQTRSIVNGAQAAAGSAVILTWSALPGIMGAWQRWRAGSKRLTGIVPEVYVPPG